MPAAVRAEDGVIIDIVRTDRQGPVRAKSPCEHLDPELAGICRLVDSLPIHGGEDGLISRECQFADNRSAPRWRYGKPAARCPRVAAVARPVHACAASQEAAYDGVIDHIIGRDRHRLRIGVGDAGIDGGEVHASVGGAHHSAVARGKKRLVDCEVRRSGQVP